jgi:Fe-S-cluster containining protein
MNIDTTELEGKAFSCIENCAMCCLCQPGLDVEEVTAFEKAGLTDGLTRENVQGYVSEDPTVIKLQGSNGACHFLKDRSCTIYEQRPRFCRQFPVHVHALHRIQLNANLSCRGIAEGGDTLGKFGSDVISSIPNEGLNNELAGAKERIRWFEERCRDRHVYQETERLRSTVDRITPHLGEERGIGRLLAFANSEPDIGEMPEENIVQLVLASEPPDDLEEIAIGGNLELLDLADAALPVYVDEKLRWNTYRSRDGKIHWMSLHEDGTLESRKVFGIEDITLLPPDKGALKVFSEYARLLNSRDPFLGYAFHDCAQQDFQYDLMTVYFGLLATTMLDLWWRSTLVGKMLDVEKLNSHLASEGIIAFDMGCLGMPTLGETF